jgi:hypothetical protein
MEWHSERDSQGYEAFRAYNDGKVGEVYKRGVTWIASVSMPDGRNLRSQFGSRKAAQHWVERQK